MSDIVKAASILAVAIVINGWFTGYRLTQAGGMAVVLNPVGGVSWCFPNEACR